MMGYWIKRNAFVSSKNAMLKPILLLLSFLILVLLVTLSKMSPTNTLRPSWAILFYFLTLIISIISLITGVYKIIAGKKTVISFVYILCSIMVGILSYYEIT